MDKSLRIVYMGTPDFAVEALSKLVEGGYNIVGVITMPDKPVGRHQTELQQSPVKKYALEHGLKVLQPEKLKDEAFLEELRSLQADLQIVVAFRMLPEVVWAMPRFGTFNLHAALLPNTVVPPRSTGPSSTATRRLVLPPFSLTTRLIQAKSYSALKCPFLIPTTQRIFMTN